jgi:hypothetical protein
VIIILISAKMPISDSWTLGMRINLWFFISHYVCGIYYGSYRKEIHVFVGFYYNFSPSQCLKFFAIKHLGQ